MRLFQLVFLLLQTLASCPAAAATQSFGEFDIVYAEPR